LAYNFFRLAGPILRALPLEWCLFLGRRIGDALYYFDYKHKSLAYSNIKRAFSDKLNSCRIPEITKEFYQKFGQNIIEIFLIPGIDKKHLDKYIEVAGKENISEAFKNGKGVILLGVHAGSWELSNIICANLGFTFNLLVREQNFQLFNQLLNSYRKKKGCKLIETKNQTRQLIQALKNNEAVGMTADQGGKTGELVKFFGRSASMPTGAIRLALKYGAVILPAYYTRVNGPYQKVIIEPAFTLKKTGNEELDIKNNLEEITGIFERLISKYPSEYLWTYKIWKYSSERNILILSDKKAGHLRQSQAVAEVVTESLGERNIKTNIDTIDIEFKDNLSRHLLTLSSVFSGKYLCQGCLWCLKTFLKPGVFNGLVKIKPDIIISCGSSLAALNFIVSRELIAKSIVLMRPSVLSTSRFNLVIMSRHDRPMKRKNVIITEGALNLIDENYLKKQAEELLRVSSIKCQASSLCIGLLIGGNTKEFQLEAGVVGVLIKQLKQIADEKNAEIMVTTSRRTPVEIENLLKAEFEGYPRCKKLIIANVENPAYAIGGILGLSDIVVSSPESISMISEAVSSRKYVVVFNAKGLSRKHQRFLEYFSKKKYIFLINPEDLNKTIENIIKNNPEKGLLEDRGTIKAALEKLL